MDKSTVINMVEHLNTFSQALYNYVNKNDVEMIEGTLEFITHAVDVIKEEISSEIINR